MTAERGLGLVLAVLVAYGALVLVAFLAQRSLLFFPQPTSSAALERLRAAYPAVASVGFAADDGTPLHAWWHPPNAPDAPVFLYFGGNGENVSWMLPRVAGPGAAVPGAGWLLVDYRGYGRSAGTPGERELVADALLAYALVRGRVGPDQPVFAIGRSLGSGVAVQLAARRDLAGLVFVTPFDSVVAVAQRHYPFLPVRALLRHRFDSLAVAPSLATPALFVAAMRDEVVPPEHARRLHDAWGGPTQWLALEGVGHNDTDRVDYWPEVQTFAAAHGRVPAEAAGAQGP